MSFLFLIFSKRLTFHEHTGDFLFYVQDYNAKLSDFGLATDGPQGEDSHITTCVMGTEGYAAPEYINTGTIL